MSGPTVTARHTEERGVMLIWGGETFYDFDNNLITWDTEAEAVAWLRKNHPELKFKATSENAEDKADTNGKVKVTEQIGLWEQGDETK